MNIERKDVYIPVNEITHLLLHHQSSTSIVSPHVDKASCGFAPLTENLFMRNYISQSKPDWGGAQNSLTDKFVWDF